MKEPEDILREIRSLLGEDIEKIEEEKPQEGEIKKEEPIEKGGEIERLLSEIEEEPPLESQQPKEQPPPFELEEEVEKEFIPPIKEEAIEPLPGFEKPSEEPTPFELEEEEPEISDEGLGIREEMEIKTEKSKEEIPPFGFEEEPSPSFGLEEEKPEEQEFTPEIKEEATPSQKTEGEIPPFTPEEQTPSFKLEKGIKEEFIEPEGEKIFEEKGVKPEIIIAESQEQEEIGALLKPQYIKKEEIKKKPAIPKKPIKINIFIPLLILTILGIIGALSFLLIFPNKELKNSISKIEMGRVKEGEEAFNKWIGLVFLKNQKIHLYHQRGEAYLSINDYYRAVSTFWTAFKEDPYNQDTQVYILSSTLKREGLEKAKENAERILLKDKKSIPSYLILSRYMEKRGESKKAISYLETGLKASPSNLSVISSLMKLYFKDKQYGKLISLHRFLIDHLKIKKPLNPELVVKASGHFIKMGRLDIGKPPLEEILRAFPENIEGRYFLSLCLLKEGNKERATYELKTILKNENHPPAYNLLGEILRDEGKYIEAASFFSKACFYNPHFAKAHYNLGDTAFYNLNDYSTSIKGYEDARKNGYTNHQLSYNLGVSYYLKGRYEDAKNEFKSLPEDKTILYNIACCNARLKNFSLAIAGFKKAERLCKERLCEKISTKEEKGLYLFLSNIYNNLGLISEVSGSLSAAQERYWDAINTAKLAGIEHKEAFLNLTNLFNSKANSLSSLSDKLDKGYKTKD